jgi:hypothetical protein
MRLAKVSITQLIPQDLAELWEERAAIMQYEGGLTRQAAEWAAFVAVCTGESSDKAGPCVAA